MNGNERWIIAVGGSVIAFLLGLVITLIGWAVRSHVEHDKDRNKEIWDELKRHRDRLHDIVADISAWKIRMLEDLEKRHD